MTTSLSSAKLLQSWDASKQDAWRSRHPEDLLLFHFIVDASPSMHPYAAPLMQAYNRYLRWLQGAAHPMSLAETWAFDLGLTALVPMQALGTHRPLDATRYRPQDGDGTALYNAVGQVCTTAAPHGQHLLIVFTDGEDSGRESAWTAGRCHELLTTLQDVSGWLCVFLGAFTEALAVARSMGFREGNTLVFPNEDLPAAFATLQRATGRYLQAAPPARKLLAARGIF